METRYCGVCGRQFETRSHNKLYCTAECRKKAQVVSNRNRRAQERQERKLELEKAKAKVNPTPSLSMNAMLKLMAQLSKERGRIVQYGELQSDLATGRVKLIGGTIV